MVDATGMQRALLPKVKNDIIVPCIEYQVKSKKFPWDDFYIKPYPGLSGYLWYLPSAGMGWPTSGPERFTAVTRERSRRC